MTQEEKEMEKKQDMNAEACDNTQAETQAEQPKAEGHESRKERRKRHERHAEQDQKVQEMGEKLAEMNDKYVRLYSEYENYRKRTNVEKADLLINGSKEMMKAILPVIDDFERALTATANDEGVQLIYNKMMKILEQKGLKAMEVKGEKFDENQHEAITRIPAVEDAQKGTVVDVVEKGYYLNDKVLRYAKVVVAF